MPAIAKKTSKIEKLDLKKLDLKKFTKHGTKRKYKPYQFTKHRQQRVVAEFVIETSNPKVAAAEAIRQMVVPTGTITLKVYNCDRRKKEEIVLQIPMKALPKILRGENVTA